MSTSNTEPSSPNSNEKFIFKCVQQTPNISQELHRFHEQKEFFDIILIAGNDCIKIPAHKIVLAALSEYFLELFRSCPTTTFNLNEVNLKQIEASSLKLLVDFMYSGSIEFEVETFEALLRSAVFLKMKNLINGCSDFLERILNTSNCYYWLHLSSELSLAGLKEKSSNFIYNHFEEVVKKPEFLLLNENELKDLLFKDNHHTDIEEQVFLSLMNWIEYEKVNRQHLLLELLSMVRYQFLTPKFINENRTEENCKLTLDWLLYHLSPESRTIEQQNFSLSPKRRKIENKEIGKVAVVFLNKQNEAEIRSYDQTLNTWSVEKKSHPLWKAITQCSMIVIDEKLFVVSGINNFGCAMNSVECLDLKTLLWTDLPPMRSIYYNTQLANLNGNLCVFGDLIEVFNVSTLTWNNIKRPSIKLTAQSKILGHKGILYIFDFHYDCLQIYDISSNEWTSRKQPIDDSVKDFRIVAVGYFVYAICICGDYCKIDGVSITSYTRAVVKRYDISKDIWYEVTEIPENKSSVKMVTIIGNNLFIMTKPYGSGNEITVKHNLDTNEFTYFSSTGCTNESNLYILPFKL